MKLVDFSTLTKNSQYIVNVTLYLSWLT